MSNIWFTSDTHFCHDKPFVYEPRGFSSIQEMNEAVIERWNSVVAPDDTVYHLGDLMLMDNEGGLECLSRLNGAICFVSGNHDTDRRIASYIEQKLVWLGYSFYVPYENNGYKGKFYLSHYPTITDNYDSDKPLTQRVINLHGHTHSKEKFYDNNPLIYNVGMDAHDCYPVNLDQIITDIKEKL